MLAGSASSTKRLLEVSRQADPDVAESLRQAVQIYTGDYLTDVDAEWAAATRAELHHQFFEALERLIGILLRQRCYDEIIALCHRGLEIDYFHENLHRALMFSLAVTGHATGAVRHYEAVTKRLAHELKTTPMAEITSLVARIRAGEPLDTYSL